MKGSTVRRGARFVTERNGVFRAHWRVADEKGQPAMATKGGFATRAEALAHLKEMTGSASEVFTYEARWFSNHPATGERRQHSKSGFVTKRAAEQHLASVLAKVAEGTWQPERRLSVKQLLEDHWLPAQLSRGLRLSTVDLYEGAVNHYLVPALGGRRVSSLAPGDISALVTQMLTARSPAGRDGLSPRTAQIAVGAMKAATAWAMRNGLVARDPLVGVQRPRIDHVPMRIWTAEQARTFLVSVRGERLEVVWALFLTRGPRRGEVAGMRWEDVDLDARTWQVSRTRVVVNGKVIDSTPKTAAGRRSIPLDERLVALLRSHRARQAAEKLAAGEVYEDRGYIVADELGHPYYPDSLSTWFDHKHRALGLPRIRLHDTRHTAASLMLAAGVPVKVVSEMLGHSSPTITLSIYAHVLPGMAEEAGAALSAQLL